MAKAETAELVTAAQTIEDEQRALEALVYALHETELQSETTIHHAAHDLQKALEQQEMLAQSLRALGHAMAHMQQRQQAAVTALSVRAEEIRARRARLSELMLRYAALGSKAAELLQSTSAILESADRSAALAAAEERIGPIVDEATALAKTARQEGFTEVAHEAGVLQQKFQTIKNQLGAGKVWNR